MRRGYDKIRCYSSHICSTLDCSVHTGIYCSSSLWALLQGLNINPYDVRKKCVKEEDGQFCYKQMEWIGEWMKCRLIWVPRGVVPTFRSMCLIAPGAIPCLSYALVVLPRICTPSDFSFPRTGCNIQVNQGSFFQGDGTHNSAVPLPLLLEAVC